MHMLVASVMMSVALYAATNIAKSMSHEILDREKMT